MARLWQIAKNSTHAELEGEQRTRKLEAERPETEKLKRMSKGESESASESCGSIPTG
jgi:hypothetical protein